MAAMANIIPRDMIIMQSNQDKVWRWFPEKGVEMCLLLEAPWVFTCGSLIKPQLQKLTQYDVIFHVGQTQDHGDPNYTFKFELPSGLTCEQTLTLPEKDYDIKVGSFTTLEQKDYEYIHVYLYSINTNTSKKGLIIKGVSVTPSKFT